MESLGITAKVDEPTSWRAGIVMVAKKDGEIHIIHVYAFTSGQ